MNEQPFNLREIRISSGGRGFLSALCDDEEELTLQQMAVRPPAGLVLCKYGSRSVVGAIPLKKRTVVLKYYYPRSRLKCFTYGLLGSRARRSWFAGLALTQAGIGTAEPLAWIEWKSLGGLLLDRSFLANRHVAGSSLQEFALQNVANSPKLAAVADKLRTAFDLMAENRIAHGDLKATNIIIGDDDAVSFIDLDATTVGAPSSKWKALRGRDVKLFFENWKNAPDLRRAFGNVFAEHTATS
jgi:hypothetical protein